MADFENGFPPSGADLSDKKIDTLSLEIKPDEIDKEKTIHSISIDSQNDSGQITVSVKNISVNSIITGNELQQAVTSVSLHTEGLKNNVFFYL